jgi:hypothetical protein
LLSVSLLPACAARTPTPQPRPTLPSDNLPARQRIKDIRNYMVYYSKGRAAELAHYDLAILQPDTLSRSQLKALRNKGVLTVAYLSIGEVEPEREWYTDGRYDSSWELGKNENWGSYFVDAGQPGWQKLMLDLTHQYLDFGFDGVFLDTVDTVDLFPQTRAGMLALIETLRKTYPQALLIQNRGFNLLNDVASTLDAVMFEAYSTDYNFATQEYSAQDNAQLANELFRLNQTSGLVILTLDYAPPSNPGLAARAVRASKNYGFIPSVSTIMLDDIPDYGLEKGGPADMRVNWIRADGDMQEVTLSAMLENAGLSRIKDAQLHYLIDGKEVKTYARTFEVGETYTWKLAWAPPQEGALIEVRLDSPSDGKPEDNSLQWTFHESSLVQEPLLPPEQQKRRTAPNTPDMTATYLAQPLKMDGDLADWEGLPCTEVNTSQQVSFGNPADWQGSQDLSGKVCYAWDEKNLYVAFSVQDDVNVQRFTDTSLWQGDHVELWFDTMLQTDFDINLADGDDYQLGVSPGDFNQVKPAIYIWTPPLQPEDYRNDIEYKVIRNETGYQAELRIPSKILRGLRMAAGQAIGVSFEPSDTDTPGGATQEMMMSSAPASSSQWGNPQNWNNLVFVKK